MPLLASDIGDIARAILNDNGAVLYDNTALLPYIKIASKDAEKKLIIHGYSGTKMASAAIDVAASLTVASALTLPADFLIPIKLFERPDGGTNADWVPMTEKDFEPENFVATTTIQYWTHRNLQILLPPCQIAREILLEYERILPVISAANSPIENTTIVLYYMGALTAEYAAGQIGMNETIAASIHNRFTTKAEDDMERLIVLFNQGLRFRRRRFTTKNIASTSLG